MKSLSEAQPKLKEIFNFSVIFILLLIDSIFDILQNQFSLPNQSQSITQPTAPFLTLESGSCARISSAHHWKQ